MATHAMPHSGASLCRIIGTRRISSSRPSAHPLLQRQDRLEHPLPHLALFLQDVRIDRHSGSQRERLSADGDALRIELYVDAIHRLAHDDRSDLFAGRPHGAADSFDGAAILAEALEWKGVVANDDFLARL